MDSRGHMVTRWVKPADSKSASPLPVPAATVIHNDTPAILRALNEAFRYQPITIPSDMDMFLVETRLDAVPSDTARMIKEKLDADPDDYNFQAMLISALNGRKPSKVVDDLVYMYTNLDDEMAGADLSMETEWSETGFAAEGILSDVLRSASTMQLDGIEYQYGVNRLRDLDDESINKTMAVYYAIAAIQEDQPVESPLYYDKDLTPLFLNPEVAQYIADNHSRVADILDIMITRDSYDIRMVDEVLNSASPSMRSGAL